MIIHTNEELRELYGFPKGRAKNKILSKLEFHAINFIKHAPFLVLSTSNKEGKHDASPRGGNPGFVKMMHNSEIVIPDAKGNNLVDSLSNIVETGKVGILFMIPGVDETLRINGGAYISTDKNYLALFASEQNPPKACIVITIEEVFLHCAKAFMRSKLWDESAKIDRDTFPTMGQMINDQLGVNDVPETREAMVKRYQKDL